MGFSEAWAKTGALEAGYVDDPSDAGGATNHGVTEAVARAHGYAGDMRDLPLATATAIAKAAYWDVMALDQVSATSDAVAALLFDAGFMSGPGTAALFFQRALNIFNRQGRDYHDVAEDGHAGPATAAAFLTYMQVRSRQGGESVMLKALNCQRGAFFIAAGARRPADEDFEFGWFQNRIHP